jgi:hypothetical protein
LLRNSAAGHYSLGLHGHRGLSVRRYHAETKDDSLLIDQPIPGTAAQSEDLELEFRAVGAKVSVKVNGEEVQFAEDTRVKEGQMVLAVSKKAMEEYGEPTIKKLEYAVLDPEPAK